MTRALTALGSALWRISDAFDLLETAIDRTGDAIDSAGHKLHDLAAWVEDVREAWRASA